MPDSVVFPIRLNRELKSAAEAVAAAENRTLANLIETELIKRVGFTKPRRSWNRKKIEKIAA
jgi:hypothetical protein